MKLTKHFSLSEFEYSATAIRYGIDNSVPDRFIPSIVNLCNQVLEPLRQHVGVPVIISSGYRCPQLNRLVGGVPNSQHMAGEAADIVLPASLNPSPSTVNRQLSTLREWYEWIYHNCHCHQLLWEHNRSHHWIHVSCKL